MSARGKLASLWLAQTARVLADWCLRLVAVLEVAGARERLTAWQWATALFIAPFLLLAPLNGCLSNALPRHRALACSSLFALLAVAGFALTEGPWLACLGVVAVGSAVNSAARYAMLPAAAIDARLPLPRVNGWIDGGAAAAVLGGAALGLALPTPRVVFALLGLNILATLAALPTAFPSDVRRPEGPVRAVAGFFRDLGRIARAPDAVGALAGLSALQALVTAAAGVLVALAPARDGLLEALVLLGVGAALGCATAALQGHPYRSLGLVPFGGAGLLLGLGWAIGLIEPNLDRRFAFAGAPAGPCLLLGFMAGLVNVPLRAAYLAAVPADARGNGASVMNAAISLLTVALAGSLVGLARGGLLTTSAGRLALLAGLAGAGALMSAWLLRLAALSVLIELALLPLYRIRAHGPGAALIPRRGPLLLIANHSAYPDPFWLYKVVPRRFTPMMTSAFYDLPVVSWLMRRVVGAIRVESGRFRREAPELEEAIARLRQGDCVLIFPEGILRRSEVQIQRPFGQGVWHILRAVPEVPVVVCWIEGGWGSFLSYAKGPPGRNKRLDRGRPIDIAFAEPAPLPPEVLADQRATRAYLMRACLECRRYLGLPVPAPAEADEG